MPNIVREDIDNLNAVLTVTLEKAAYEPKFKSELNKYRKEASMKGFRKGKTPISVLKKMFGKSALAEVINKMLQEELSTYIDKESLSLLGQPIPSEDQEPIDFDVRDLNDYVFKFDVGLAPEFELEGISEDNTFEKYQVEVTEDLIDKDLNDARKRTGQRIHPEENIEEEDVLTLAVKELEGEAVKEGGLESEFSVSPKDIFDEATREAILSKKKEDVLPINIFKLEKEGDEQYVKRYYLKLEGEEEVEFNELFEATIKEVTRQEIAPLDQDFFDKAFGQGAVSSEEEARAKIKGNLEQYYNRQAESLLFRDFQDSLIEKNILSLPDAFLKRWMLTTNENTTAQQIDQQYDSFTKNLQWELIKGKLAKQFDIKIDDNDVLENMKKKVRSYFGGAQNLPDDLITSSAQRLMEDEQQVRQAYDEVISDKLFDVVNEKVSVKSKSIDVESFDEIIRKAREEAMAAQVKAATVPAEEEE